MKYQKLTHYDTANGPGIRTVLWVSGCEHHCKGCHNPQTWDRNSGVPYDWNAEEDLRNSLNNPHIRGITLSGGDPLATYNRYKTLEIIEDINLRHPDKEIWCYTGYLWEEVKMLKHMKYIDVLVDGKYIEEQRNIALPYCGSENQRVIDVQKSLQQNKVVLWWNNPSL